MAGSVKRQKRPGERSLPQGDDSIEQLLGAVEQDSDRAPGNHPTLAAGVKVTDNIELVRLLDEGGMGSVWVAKHKSLAIEVAVKFISGSLSSGGTDGTEAIRRFKREARAAAQIKSPHVVKIFDHGLMESGVPFIVMEHLEGASLAHRLDETPLSVDEAACMLAQVAEVLDRAHALGLVHRDIKPANLFLVQTGYGLFTKVLDFGLAKQLKAPETSHITGSGATFGTTPYMSPGQIRSTKNVGPEADLWALAVTTYEALSGRLPFLGETAGATLIDIATADFEPVSSHIQDLPEALHMWFRKALDKNPDARFESAKAMSDAFATAVKGVPAPSADRVSATSTTERAPSSVSFADTIRHDDTDPDVAAPTPEPTTPPSTFGGAANSVDSDPPPSALRPRSTMPMMAALTLGGLLAFGFLWDRDTTNSDSTVTQPNAAPAAQAAIPRTPVTNTIAKPPLSAEALTPPSTPAPSTIATTTASARARGAIAPRRHSETVAPPPSTRPANSAQDSSRKPAPSAAPSTEVPWLIDHR